MDNERNKGATEKGTGSDFVKLNREKLERNVQTARHSLQKALHESIEKENKFGCHQNVISGLSKLDG